MMRFDDQSGLLKYRRTVIVGTTGSGKTTLARALAKRFSIPHIELDALHWGPNWTPATRDDFRECVAQALVGDTWVVDGNYSMVRDIVWSRADTLIWLDYSLWVIYRRLIPRTLRRIVSQEELFNGNRETWREGLFSRDSLFWWALKTHRTRRQKYEAELASPERAHLTVYRFRQPHDTDCWLAHQ